MPLESLLNSHIPESMLQVWSIPTPNNWLPGYEITGESDPPGLQNWDTGQNWHRQGRAK